MKKILFGTAMAALAMLSACETLAPVDGAPSGSISGAGSATGSEQVTLTATIGSDTKTYLEWDGRVFKTRWAEGDEIMVLDNKVDYTKNDLEDHYGWFELTAGAGESTAEFTLGDGILPESYVAAYGEVWPNETTGEYMMWISTHQYRMQYETKSGELIQGFDSFQYPMVAEATGTSCTFRNLCAVLKLSLTGNGELLKNVYVSSLDEGVYLAGAAILDLTASRPTLRFSPEDVVPYPCIEFEPRYYDEENEGYVDEYLSSDPVECYIVLPAQTYPSGLKITIETENGLMEVETEDNLVLEQSELREIPVLEYESTLSYEGTWRISSEYSDFPAIMTEEGEYFVYKNFYVDGYDRLYLYDGNSEEYGWSSDYGWNTTQFTNTCGQLEMDGNQMYIRHEGYYDLYLDVDNLQLFIMSAGTVPGDLPTQDDVVCQNYWTLKEDVSDGTLVKVYGVVSAVYQRGFILTLDGWGSPILVYTYDSDAGQKAALADLIIGQGVELYAEKTTYNELPELHYVSWSNVYGTDELYGYNYAPTDISSYLEGYSSDSYGYISLFGKLNISGNYYNITVEGAQTYKGSISYPLQDLAGYDGKDVYVEGFYLGTSGSSNKYVNIMLTRIGIPDIGGSTEDVIPDDDIIVSSR